MSPPLMRGGSLHDPDVPRIIAVACSPTAAFAIDSTHQRLPLVGRCIFAWDRPPFVLEEYPPPLYNNRSMTALVLQPRLFSTHTQGLEITAVET